MAPTGIEMISEWKGAVVEGGGPRDGGSTGLSEERVEWEDKDGDEGMDWGGVSLLSSEEEDERRRERVERWGNFDNVSCEEVGCWEVGADEDVDEEGK